MKGVLSEPSIVLCPLCGLSYEFTFHLFVTGEKALSVWSIMFMWLGRQVVIHFNLRNLLGFFISLGVRVKYRGGFLLVWNVVMWYINPKIILSLTESERQ